MPKDSLIDHILDHLSELQTLLQALKDEPTAELPFIKKMAELKAAKIAQQITALTLDPIQPTTTIHNLSIENRAEVEYSMAAKGKSATEEEEEEKTTIEKEAIVIEKEVAIAEKATVAEKEITEETVQETAPTPKVIIKKIAFNAPITDNIPTTSTVTLDVAMQRKLAKDLRKAFSLNDRFRFKRELFDNDEQLFNISIDRLNNMNNIDEAYQYITTNWEWDMDSEVVTEFMEIIERRFL